MTPQYTAETWLLRTVWKADSTFEASMNSNLFLAIDATQSVLSQSKQQNNELENALVSSVDIALKYSKSFLLPTNMTTIFVSV